jgi:hypothetical protein
MTKDEALDLALEAIQSDLGTYNIPPTSKMLEAITAIKQARSAPEEPVAWMDGYRNIYSLEEKATGCPEATIPLGPIANQLANQRGTSGSPVASELHCICGAEWEWHNRDWELVATPPNKQRWAVFCGDCHKEWSVPYEHPGKATCTECEAKLKEKNNG